jgi:hypothetical protein
VYAFHKQIDEDLKKGFKYDLDKLFNPNKTKEPIVVRQSLFNLLPAEKYKMWQVTNLDKEGGDILPLITLKLNNLYSTQKNQNLQNTLE